AEYDASSMNLGGGFSFGVGDQASNPDAKPGENTEIENKGSVSAPGVLAAKDDDSSTTKSGISGGAVVITDEKKQQELTGKDADTTVAELNRDVNSSTDSNGLDKIFDEEEIKNGFEITQAFVQEANTFVQQQAAQLEQDKEALDAELKKPLDQQNPERIQALTDSIEQGSTWEMGGTGRTVLTALTTAASGNVTGSASQMIESAAVNYLQSLGAQKVKAIADKLDSEKARAALHAIVGCAGASAQGNSCSSGAAGASAAVVVNNLLDRVNDVKGSELSDTEKEDRKNLVISIIAGVTDAAGGVASVAAAASQIEAENNALFVPLLIAAGVALEAVDKYLLAADIAELAQAIADNDDHRAVEIGSELAISGGLEVLIGTIPGSTIATKIALNLKKKGHDDLAEKLGGAHRETSKPVNDGLDSHHCPAKDCYKNSYLSQYDGPAIKMAPADHRKTASYGSSPEAKAYRKQQQELIENGQFMEAVRMDILDIRSKFGDKYDDNIEQMLDYAKSIDPDMLKK
ncbi:hypothetical protein, partial [Endozoicomonas sp. ALE010]|uniref:hypothetical protein n=2 Tax=unclassified Endozoicomonas TaxID=2644528 RepID=UPI003BB70719